jgi:poly-gamma-glutamate synthesis protein (capsule biosynthesis protein)
LLLAKPVAALTTRHDGSDAPIAALYTDAQPYVAAMTASQRLPAEFFGVTGAIVPHHLLAIDVIARVFQSIQSNRYRTVFVLFPDHFSRARTPVATTPRPFQTPFGLVETDSALATQLIDDHLVAEAPGLFEAEHGVHAILPFIARVFPGVRVVPLALRIDMTGDQISALIDRLRPLTGPGTLTLLSSDFSHYLPHEVAIRRDQEVLNLLAAKDYGALAGLRQPDHIDSLAGLRVQVAVQDRQGSELVVIENKNAQQYTAERMARTTSYVGAVFVQGLELKENRGRPTASLCFGGDVFTGRNLRSLVTDPRIRDAIAGYLRDAVGNCPLVVNYEGVQTTAPVVGAPHLRLWADAEDTLNLFKRIGVVALSLANNHSNDLGEPAYQEMARGLREAGFQVIEHGTLTDLGRARVLGLTEVTRREGEQVQAITDADFGVLRHGATKPPLLAFLHWGQEFEAFAREPQTALARRLSALGVAGIIGSHPHCATADLSVMNGGKTLVAYSLGNLLFDQFGPKASGALLEVYLFDQGTFFMRRVGIHNLYEVISSKPMEPVATPSLIAPPDPPPLRPLRFPTIKHLRKTSCREPLHLF